MDEKTEKEGDDGLMSLSITHTHSSESMRLPGIGSIILSKSNTCGNICECASHTVFL